MKNNKHDFLLALKSAQYYQHCERYNSIARTTAIRAAKSFNTSGNIANYPLGERDLEKKVIFGLGFIATLLLLSLIGLHQSLNVATAKAIKSNTDSEQALIFNTKKLSTTTYVRKINRQRDDRDTGFSANEIEILTIKNTVSQGKF